MVVIFGERHQTFLERGKCLLRCGGGASAIQTQKRKSKRQPDGASDDDKEDKARAGNAGFRKGESVRDQHQNDGGYQSRGQHNRCSAQQRTEPQAPFQLLDIAVELFARGHDSSRSVLRYRPARKDSANAAASTNAIAYHQML